MLHDAQRYYADNAWFPQGWYTNLRLDVDAKRLTNISAEIPQREAIYLGRYLLPGMPNLHSHAFQRAMSGLAEYRTRPEDSFWTWREVMYRFAATISPGSLKAIATQLYVEMLKSGFTHVCEFHYLHHRSDGTPYLDPDAMSVALIEASQEAGIGLTLLPTLYMTGGFDGRALQDRQKRFFHTIDTYLALIERLRNLQNDKLKVGIALHSLRAVPPDALRAIIDSGLIGGCPVHIHIAEQVAEVHDCLTSRSARPVEWLLDHAPVDKHWCLVHATHMTEEETQRVATTGAVIGLCPTTEANLGDGFFPLKNYLDATGLWGIGSDSHISVSPIEELRWLEYGQRLQSKQRNIAISSFTNSVGETLWSNALRGGLQASGMSLGKLNVGNTTLPAISTYADWIVLDDQSPLLAARDISNVLDTWIFAGTQNLVRDVMVAGKWVVRDFHHVDEERIAERYRTTVESLIF